MALYVLAFLVGVIAGRRTRFQPPLRRVTGIFTLRAGSLPESISHWPPTQPARSRRKAKQCKAAFRTRLRASQPRML